VGERRSHAAHQIEARGVRRARLLLHETRLRIASQAVGAFAFADDHADNQSGDCENQHLRLEFGELGCVVA